MGRVHGEEGEQERRPVQDGEADRLVLVDDREGGTEGIGVRLGQRHLAASEYTSWCSAGARTATARRSSVASSSSTTSSTVGDGRTVRTVVTPVAPLYSGGR